MTKQVTVRYFAMFREHAGVDEEVVATDAGDAQALFRELENRHGSAEPAGHCKVAINDEMADWHAPIADGDVVLLFPPVAGG